MISVDGLTREEYKCKFKWPEKVQTQHGKKGIKVSKNGNYTTAFFEVFNINVTDSYIRGEGKTVEDAERKAFNRYDKMKECNEHDFRRVGETVNAQCILCNSCKYHFFEPLEKFKCKICDQKSVRFRLPDGTQNVYCYQHYFESLSDYIYVNKNKYQKILDMKNKSKEEYDLFYENIYLIEYIAHEKVQSKVPCNFDSESEFNFVSERYTHKMLRDQKEITSNNLDRMTNFILIELMKSGFFKGSPKYLKDINSLRLFFHTIINFCILNYILKQNAIKGVISFGLLAHTPQLLDSLIGDVKAHLRTEIKILKDEDKEACSLK